MASPTTLIPHAIIMYGSFCGTIIDVNETPIINIVGDTILAIKYTVEDNDGRKFKCFTFGSYAEAIKPHLQKGKSVEILNWDLFSLDNIGAIRVTGIKFTEM